MTPKPASEFRSSFFFARRSAVRLTVLAGILSALLACSKKPTEPESNATITLVSGGNQTITIPGITPSAAYFPEPVVVYVESNGVPVSEGSILAAVWMNGAPGPNGTFRAATGPDGRASLALQASAFPATFEITVRYVKCLGFFSCDQYETLATVKIPGRVVIGP